jgi:hypothetical protein
VEEEREKAGDVANEVIVVRIVKQKSSHHRHQHQQPTREEDALDLRAGPNVAAEVSRVEKG